jgi:hypothetical protein
VRVLRLKMLASGKLAMRGLYVPFLTGQDEQTGNANKRLPAVATLQ